MKLNGIVWSFLVLICDFTLNSSIMLLSYFIIIFTKGSGITLEMSKVIIINDNP